MLITLELTDKPSHIFNIDETCLFADPSKTRIITLKGEKTSRVTKTLVETCTMATTMTPRKNLTPSSSRSFQQILSDTVLPRSSTPQPGTSTEKMAIFNLRNQQGAKLTSMQGS